MRTAGAVPAARANVSASHARYRRGRVGNDGGLPAYRRHCRGSRLTPPPGKLLVYYVDPGEAAATRRRLRAAGIRVEVASVDPHLMQPSRSGSQRIGLWVVYADQFDDAVQLLQNPAHVPRRIVSEDEMVEARAGGSAARLLTWLRRWKGPLAIAIAIGLLGGVAYLAQS